MTPSHVSETFTQGIPSSQQGRDPEKYSWADGYRENERKGEFNGVFLLALLGCLAFWAGAAWLIARCFR